MTPITPVDQERIANDAAIAMEAIVAIIGEGTSCRLHPTYLKEKVNTVQRCIDFMKNFTEEV